MGHNNTAEVSAAPHNTAAAGDTVVQHTARIVGTALLVIPQPLPAARMSAAVAAALESAVAAAAGCALCYRRLLAASSLLLRRRVLLLPPLLELVWSFPLPPAALLAFAVWWR